jgi:hypothetical protein
MVDPGREYKGNMGGERSITLRQAHSVPAIRKNKYVAGKVETN